MQLDGFFSSHKLHSCLSLAETLLFGVTRWTEQMVKKLRQQRENKSVREGVPPEVFFGAGVFRFEYFFFLQDAEKTKKNRDTKI